MKWSTLESCRSVDCTRHQGTIADFADYIEKVRGAEKDGEAICCATFAGDKRALRNVEEVSALMLDFDAVDVKPSDALGFLTQYAFVAHSSYSHGIKDGWSFRVFLPLSRPVTAEEYSVLWQHIHNQLEVKPDAACKDASRLNYLRREAHPDATKKPFFHFEDRAPIDPDAMSVDALVDAERMRTEERRRRQDEMTKWRESNAGNEHAWLEDALRHISPNEYHVWRDVGMAIKRAGEEEGLSGAYSIWDAWSMGDDKYDSRKAQKIWDSFRGAGPSGAVTLGTVWHLATSAGWEPPKREPVTIDAGDLWGEDWGNPVAPPPAPKKKLPILRSQSEHYLAEYALEQFGFSHGRIVFDGNIWQVYDERTGVFSERENVVYSVVNDLHGAMIDTPPKLNKAGEEVIDTKYFDAKHSTCNNIENKARIMAKDAEFHDKGARGLAFTDGFFCSVRGELIAHSPTHRATVAMGIAYPRHTDAPVWEQTLRETLGEADAQTLEEYLGLCLLGRATDFQRALFLTGHGSNGKSTIIDAAAKCFPRESICHVNPHSLGSQRAEYHIMEIRGRLLNVVNEVSDKELRDAASYKSLVSGDPTSGRPPFGQVCRFKPIAGHVFLCNRLPSTSDSSDGFWRRAVVIEFGRQFHGNAIDIGRPMKLQAERSGITSRLISAGLNAIERGVIAISSQAIESAREWRVQSTPVLAFMLEKSLTGRHQFSALYKEYTQWATENGRQALNSTNFGLELQTQGARKFRSNGVWYDFEKFAEKNGVVDTSSEYPF